MAVPFRRKSGRKVREGRSVKNLTFKKRIFNLAITTCKNCNEKKILHKLCSSCLYYRGKKIA